MNNYKGGIMRITVITLCILILLGSSSIYAKNIQPKGLKAVAGDGVVYLSWSKPEKEVIGYWVYRALPDGDYQRINSNTLTETFYEDTGVVNGQFYWYTVTAVDTEGNESSQSEDVGATPNFRSSPLSGY